MTVEWLVLGGAALVLARRAWSANNPIERAHEDSAWATGPEKAVGCMERQPAADVVFLDFDGVLHPGCSGTFAYLGTFERLIRDYPQVDIILSTDWRRSADFAYLRGLFSPDVGARIVGATPLLECEYSRFAEIQATCDRYGIVRWLALDDGQGLFPPSCPNLVLFDPHTGISGEGERAARIAFEQRFGGGRQSNDSPFKTHGNGC